MWIRWGSLNKLRPGANSPPATQSTDRFSFSTLQSRRFCTINEISKGKPRVRSLSGVPKKNPHWYQYKKWATRKNVESFRGAMKKSKAYPGTMFAPDTFDHGTNLGCTTMMSHAGWKWEAWGPFSWSYLFDSGKLLLFLFLSKKWSTRHFGILRHQKKKQIQRFMVDHAGLHQSPSPGRKLHSLAHSWAQLCGWGVQWPIRLICLSLCSCLYRYDSICLYHFI